MNFSEFLTYLATSGGATVVATWALVRLSWYNSLDAVQQQWTRFGTSGALSIAALLVLNNVDQATLDALSPYFASLAGVFVIVFLGQIVEVQQRLLTLREQELLGGNVKKKSK